MKPKLNVFFIFFLLHLFVSTSSYGAFIIKSKNNIEVSKHQNSITNIDKPKALIDRKIPKLINHYINQLSEKYDNYGNGDSGKTWWQGVASILCAIFGFFSISYIISSAIALDVTGALLGVFGWLLFSILALVFGIMGTNKEKRKMRGLAIAGIVFGSIQLFILLLIAVVAAIAAKSIGDVMH